MTAPLDFSSVYGAPSVELSHVQTFLTTLHGSGDGNGNLAYTWWGRKSRAEGQIFTDKFLTNDKDFEVLTKLTEAERNLFVSVCRFSGEQRKDTDCVAVPGLWADIDVKPGSPTAIHTQDELRTVVRSFPQTTMLVGTGSGGVHAYWLFDHPAVGANVQRVRELMPAWLVKLSAKASEVLGREIRFDSVGDLARVLRLPGTVRWKSTDVPTQSLILQHSPSTRYPLDLLSSRVEPEYFETVRRTITVRQFDKGRRDEEWFEGAQNGLNGSASQHDHLLRAIGSKIARGEADEAQAVDFGEKVISLYTPEDPNWPWEREDVIKIVKSSMWMAPEPLVVADDALQAWALQTTQEAAPEVQEAPPAAPDPAPVVPQPEDPTAPPPPVALYPNRANGQWPTRSWDVIGLAQRMVDHFGDRMRWVGEAGEWAFYEEGRWDLDRTDRSEYAVHMLLEDLPKTEAASYSDVAKGQDPMSPREKFLKWVTSQRTSASIEGTKRRLRPYLAKKMNDFDCQPMLLNARNGVVDLATGELRPSSPDDHMMMQTNVAYDPDAPCPRWQAFLDRVMPEQDKQIYLQQIAGYSLTGNTGEQVMFLHVGRGANGKSVFMDVLKEILGEYAQTVPSESIVQRKGEKGVPNDIARMKGRRFLQVSETDAGRSLDEALVKQLTGGEHVTARFMHKEFFEFKPVGKIHYTTNHPPGVSSSDSIWRRIHRLDWQVVIPESERDHELASKIVEEEAAGVLAWAIKGCLDWQRNGLQMPHSVRMAVDEYREDQDVFRLFLSECTVPDEDARVTNDDLYTAYRAWCEQAGIRAWSKVAFGRELTNRDILTYRTSTERGRIGLRLTGVSEFLAGF